MSELHEVRCCADSNLGSGWTKHENCNVDVWGESEINGNCEDSVDHGQAMSMCASMGGRLCTAAELLSDCTRGSGCMHDQDMIWSSTEVVAPTNSPTAEPTPEVCYF